MAASQKDSENIATHVVELTPTGRGAVAVVLVAGPEALSAVQRHFIANSGRALRSAPLRQVVVGKWGSAAGEEVVVARRGDQQLEVHCHGGTAAVRRIVDDLIGAGCRELSWRDWLGRGQVPPERGRCDAEAERDAIARCARIALAEVVTMRTAAVLLDQMSGALSAALRKAIELVCRGDWAESGRLLDELLSRRELGLHLTSPWRVVLAGPPNVGKSSLTNALAGFQRVLVSPRPGTTRDVVTLTTAIDGWPVELADTAGLRGATDELESAGVRLAVEALRTADLVLLVHDASRVDTPLPAEDEATAWNWLAGRQRVINVWNKIDLRALPMTFALEASECAGGEFRVDVRTSAATGEGIRVLAAAIGRALVPDPPPMGAAVPFTASQVESLVVARQAVARGHAAPAQEALQSLLAYP